MGYDAGRERLRVVRLEMGPKRSLPLALGISNTQIDKIGEKIMGQVDNYGENFARTSPGKILESSTTIK